MLSKVLTIEQPQSFELCTFVPFTCF